MTDRAAPLLSVRDLRIGFPLASGGTAVVVDGISYDVAKGEIVALVGESGCGKSVSGLALLDLVPEPGRVLSGEVIFEGRDVLKLPEREKEKIRGGGIGFVFQEPSTALDPVRTIGSELVAVLKRHRGLSTAEAKREAVEWLRRVSLPDPERRMDDYPHRMSGGMRQRAMIALALAGGPRFVVADEPTTALDVTVQAQILRLLKSLRDALSLAILFITHDLGVVAEVADRAIVMYAGEIVEKAEVHALFRAPAHPYTRALLKSRPQPGARRGTRLPALEGSVPEAGRRPEGCAFADRCPEVFDRCRTDRPRLLPVGGEPRSQAACFLAEESRVKAKVESP